MTIDCAKQRIKSLKENGAFECVVNMDFLNDKLKDNIKREKNKLIDH
jgi:hypothetical protein